MLILQSALREINLIGIVVLKILQQNFAFLTGCLPTEYIATESIEPYEVQKGDFYGLTHVQRIS